MKKLIWLCLALAIGFGTRCASAADLTGTWTGSMSSPDGNSFDLTYTFKQEGMKLTGTVLGPQGDALQISNGKVDGDKFSFEIDLNGMTIHHDCVIDGEQIKLTSKGSGDFPGMTMTLKRVAAAKPVTPAISSMAAGKAAGSRFAGGAFIPVPSR